MEQAWKYYCGLQATAAKKSGSPKVWKSDEGHEKMIIGSQWERNFLKGQSFCAAINNSVEYCGWLAFMRLC